MIICKHCLNGLHSRGEAKRYSTVDTDRLEELDIPTHSGYYDENSVFIYDEDCDVDIWIECQLCDEMELIENIMEV